MTNKANAPKPNIRLLRRIQKAILANPDQFMMHTFFSTELDNARSAGGCGTAACIAGWALHLKSRRKTLRSSGQASLRNIIPPVQRAAKVVGIPVTIHWANDLHPLFFADQWPEPYLSSYAKARKQPGKKGARSMAKIAANRIEHFIKTGQ